MMVGPLQEDCHIRPIVDIIENGPRIRAVTTQQAAMAYYLRDELTHGRPAFRVGLPPLVPEWVSAGMRRARDFEIMVPQSEGRSWSEKKCEYVVKEKPQNSSYNSFMWEALGNPDLSDKLVVPDELLNTNRWYECLAIAKKEISPSLAVKRNLDCSDLILYNPPLYILPGGLERSYGSSINARPVRLHSQISAASAIFRMGCVAADAFLHLGSFGE